MKRASILLALALGACADAPPPPPAPVTVAARPPADQLKKTVRVPLTSKGSGTHYIPVGISGVCCFPFLLDSGASDVSVSPDIFRAMVKDGLITKEDMIDIVKYQTAAGTSVDGLRFKMPVLTVGTLRVRNVVGSVTPGSNMLLLGQAFLRKFRFWAIDNANSTLVLGYVEGD